MLCTLEGVEVIEANNGAEAVSMVENNRPDLLLCDHEMPILNGLQVLQILRQKWSAFELPILMLTARQTAKDKVLAFRAGASDYVTKPAEPEELLARVSSHLSLKIAMAENLEAERRLMHVARLQGLGHLAAGLAHEMNTPAQYIQDNLGFLGKAFERSRKLLDLVREWVQEESGTPEQACETVRKVWHEQRIGYILDEVPGALSQSVDGVKKIATIVAELKEFAGPERRTRGPADLNRAIENTVAVTRQEFPHDAELVLELEDQLPLVECVVTEIKQAFLSILVNCAEAARGVFGGEVRKARTHISSRLVDSGVEITFSDNGPGIDPTILEQVSDPFFTTKEVGSGTGQGLSVAHRAIVDRHGGTLDFTRSAWGGTLVRVWLPFR